MARLSEDSQAGGCPRPASEVQKRNPTPFVLSLSKGLYYLNTILRQAQDERYFMKPNRREAKASATARQNKWPTYARIAKSTDVLAERLTSKITSARHKPFESACKLPAKSLPTSHSSPEKPATNQRRHHEPRPLLLHPKSNQSDLDHFRSAALLA